MPEKAKRFFIFGRFRLDPAEQVLLADGHPVSLTPKAFETLLALVENNGHILEKDELLKRVWPDTFVEEGTLVQNISTLRRVLGEGSNGYPYIETVPRRGYRFAAPVQELKDEPLKPAKISEKQIPLVPQARTVFWRIGAAGFVLILIVAGYFGWFRERSSASPPTGKIMLAVMPFSNLSSDPQQEYFSSGLTEEMITQLGNLDPGRLGVIARTSAMQYKDNKKDVREIGRELGVDYILEGSVRREGDQVRITAQLIQVKDQTHLWARDYDRNLRDILALQSDVAGAIAQEIKLKLTPEKRTRLASSPTLDPSAHEFYLKGRYFWNKRSEDGLVKAIDYFGQAIKRDPNYAQAYAGLADAYALLGSMPNLEISRAEAMPKAKAAALQALQLDDSLAEAHTSLAFVEMHYEWNWPSSEKEFKRALELNSSYATAHQWYAVWLMAQGKTSAALEEERRAQQADPLSVIIKADSAQLLVYAGDFDEAEQQAQSALEIDPDFPLARIFLGEAYVGKQQYPAAIAQLQKALALSKDDAGVLSELARTYAFDGQRSKSEATLAILQKKLHSSKDRGEFAIQVAAVYAALGNKEQAFAALEEAYQYRVGGLILMAVTPVFQSLRPDPRFDDLARRVGIPHITEHR